MLRKKCKWLIGILVAAAIICSGISWASGQEVVNWPKRKIRVYVMFSPGGTTDLVVRAICRQMERYLKVPIEIMNKPGAAGAIATEFVRKLPADGYTWLGFAGNRIYRVLGISDTVWYRDWYMWAGGGDVVSIFVRSDSPIKDFNDLLKILREKPESIVLGCAGVGGGQHIYAMRLFEEHLGLKPRYAQYKGGAPTTIACLGGEVDAALCKLPEQVDFFRSGDLRPLAIGWNKPIYVKGYGEVPLITEFVPDFDPTPHLTPFGVAVRREVPDYVVKRITDAFKFAMKQEEVQNFFEEKAIVPLGLYGEELLKSISKAETIFSWAAWKVGVAKRNPEEVGIPKVEDWKWPPKDWVPWPIKNE